MRNAQRIGRMGSWDYDPAADRLTFDAEVGQLFGLEGYGGEMSLGQLYELVHPDDRGRVMAAVAAAVGEGAPYDCEFRLCMPDMGDCVVHAVGESVAGGADGQRTLMGVAQDVSEDYRARQELIAARNAAQAASEAKSRFLATMGHELRTPLNAINGFSELIQSEAFGPVGAAQYRTYAGHIHDSGQHLLELINRILDVTRVEAGTFHLEATDVRGAALVQKTVELLSGEARRQGIAISCEPGPDVALLADPRLLRQVIFNLVNNALRFSPAGSAVRVSAGPTARGGYAVRVADRGPGIPEDQRARVLLPFTQGDDGLARKHDGLGLGLYLVRSFIELHGGDLDIDCPETGGTAVTVTLPPDRVVAVPATGK
jgi:signal transduction histidine kinase